MEDRRQTKRVETTLEIMTSHGSIIPGHFKIKLDDKIA